MQEYQELNHAETVDGVQLSTTKRDLDGAYNVKTVDGLPMNIMIILLMP